MSIMTESWLVEIILGFTLLFIALYYYLTSGYDYWKNKNIPYVEPVLGFGILLPIWLRKKSYPELLDDICKKFDKERFVGIYQYKTPSLIIKDPKLIEHILIKDFSHFEDRGLPINEEYDPLSVNLVNLTGNKWRSLRHKLTHTFSSRKLKAIFHGICECGDDLLLTIDKYTKSGEEIDTKQLTFTFSTDVVATCAFGLQIKSNTDEGKKFKEMVDKANGNTRFGGLRFSLRFFTPSLAKFFRIGTAPMDAQNYFISITKKTLEHRLKNNIKRDDFFQLLMSLMQQESELNPETDTIDKDDIQLQYTITPTPSDNHLKITEEIVAAQTFVFLAAGSESVSTTIGTALHYLAENPTIQENVQREVDVILAKHGGQWTYQALKDMVYLDQVIQEAQRMFPIALIHVRTCTSPYKIPDSDLIIDKNTNIIIPTYTLHMDPAYHTDPEKFNPDRFVGNNFKPSATFSPFGDGPRICIAMRFAILEMKVFIARVMSKYSVKPSLKTLTPLRYDMSSHNARPQGGIWVAFKQRNT